jgi:C-terminal processing protease CtpA/Prc
MISDNAGPFSVIRYKKNPSSPESLVIDPVLIRSDVVFKNMTGDIGYLSIMRFDRSSADRIKSVMLRERDFKWIVDLRKYSGGDFESFREVSKILVPETLSLSLETKNGRWEFLVGSDQTVGKRCVFVINESTILFSELLAHALKRSQSILLGKETMGFVPHLDQFYLQDGSSVVLNTGVYKLQDEPVVGVGVQPSVSLESVDDSILFSRCIKILGDL